MACLTGTLWIIISLSVPETYAPVVLSRRAEKLSKLIGNIYISNLGIGKPKMTLGTEFKAALCRSWALLFTEPIVLFMSLFVAIIYGTLYMIFAAFPIVFQTHRGCSLGIGSLAFLGIAIGVILGVCYSIWYARRCAKVSDRTGAIFHQKPVFPLLYLALSYFQLGYSGLHGQTVPAFTGLFRSLGPAFSAEGRCLSFSAQ